MFFFKKQTLQVVYAFLPNNSPAPPCPEPWSFNEGEKEQHGKEGGGRSGIWKTVPALAAMGKGIPRTPHFAQQAQKHNMWHFMENLKEDEAQNTAMQNTLEVLGANTRFMTSLGWSQEN